MLRHDELQEMSGFQQISLFAHRIEDGGQPPLPLATSSCADCSLGAKISIPPNPLFGSGRVEGHAIV